MQCDQSMNCSSLVQNTHKLKQVIGCQWGTRVGILAELHHLLTENPLQQIRTFKKLVLHLGIYVFCCCFFATSEEIKVDSPPMSKYFHITHKEKPCKGKNNTNLPLQTPRLFWAFYYFIYLFIFNILHFALIIYI